MKQPEYLFVYGTLMSGIENPINFQMAEYGEFMGLGIIPAKLYLVDYYPGAILDTQGLGTVQGEIYRLLHPKQTLKTLDTYEEYSYRQRAQSEFVRKKIEVKQLSNDEKILAWTYIFNRPTAALINLQSGWFRDAIS
jgi:gamma-glutamylcyclotransferase (GGCT)/AIG2-like uncharacterized protein YtfP